MISGLVGKMMVIYSKQFFDLLLGVLPICLLEGQTSQDTYYWSNAKYDHNIKARFIQFIYQLWQEHVRQRNY